MDGARPAIYLGHGASGSVATIAPFVEELRRLGLEAHPLVVPRGGAAPAARRVAARLPVDRPLVVGGHSFGGRVTSLVAADGRLPIVGLVCLSYPLHRPGRPETGLRTEHWPAIRCPTLLLSGERDPFARLDLLRAAVAALPAGALVTYPGLGHDLRPVAEDVCRRIAAFVEGLRSKDPSSHAP
ncbi:MAG TPA: alpha/beta family hydrolase [Candidatus Binatia bacterium]|nr:alpha/beta family hydrolase [Candidatus Binatia bacterium]